MTPTTISLQDEFESIKLSFRCYSIGGNTTEMRYLIRGRLMTLRRLCSGVAEDLLPKLAELEIKLR
jgi:hypothetical protein